MFSSGPNYSKLKTNLRLALNRLKLLGKKKSELTQKARKEIADYISSGKPERARIRVEHIIREDYLVEAMEIVEMYCDLLLARYGLITQMKELDDGIAEAVGSLIWVAPRLQADVQELKIISDILALKYGKIFADEQRSASAEQHQRVGEKLLHKMAIQAPPRLLVEKYLVEIAKIYNIDYEPDPQIMNETKPDGVLIDLSDRNNLDGNGGGGGMSQPLGFIGYPQPPPLPHMPQAPTHRPFDYPNPMGYGPSSGGKMPPYAFNIPPHPQGQPMPQQPQAPQPSGSTSSSSTEKKDLNTSFISGESMSMDDQAAAAAAEAANNVPPPSYESLSPDDNLAESAKPKPQPRSKIPPDMGVAQPPAAPSGDAFNLPNVPLDLPDIPNDDDNNNDEIDFDDLSRRFEELKKRK